MPLPRVKYSYDTRRREYTLEERYVMTFEGIHWEIREGFVFDLASIPRGFWWLISPTELSTVAALIHDFLYAHCGVVPRGAVEPYRVFSRRAADEVLLHLMRAEGVWYWRRLLAYPAVRAFGAFAWRT